MERGNKMKKEIKGNMLFAPLPVIMLGTFDENGVPNVMNAAWGGQVDTNVIVVSLSQHKTTDNLRKCPELTIAFATEDSAVVSDYFGIESGRKVNKVEKAEVSWTKSEKVNAPIFDCYPLTLEARVQRIDEEDGYWFFEVVGMVADEGVLDEKGKVDYSKCRFISFDSSHNSYRTVAEETAKAFHSGLTIRNK